MKFLLDGVERMHDLIGFNMTKHSAANSTETDSAEIILRLSCAQNGRTKDMEKEKAIRRQSIFPNISRGTLAYC